VKDRRKQLVLDGPNPLDLVVDRYF